MDCRPFADAFVEINQRFIRLLDDLSALRALAALNPRAPNEAALLRSAIHVLMHNNDLQRCSIFLVDNGVLRCAAGLDWQELIGGTHLPDPPARHTMEFPMGEGIVGRAAETGQLIHCRDCRHDGRFKSPNGDPLQTGSLLCVPVTAGDQTLAVVNVSHNEADFFDASHEQLLRVFAGFLGHMLTNWRYYHHLEQEVARRTGELQSALAEAEELKRRYHELAIIDELTGIHNRRFFYPEAGAALARTLRERQAFSLLMVDLDHFKHINDHHGHETGDRVLQMAASLLKGETREGDIIARFGGEEFVLALPNTDLEGARRLAARILDAIRSFEFGGAGGQTHVTGTIGVTALPADTQPPAMGSEALLDELLRQADRALYAGKDLGRDRVQTYGDIAQTG